MSKSLIALQTAAATGLISTSRRAREPKRVEESPVVYRVYENVVPNKIKDLDETNEQNPVKAISI